MLSKSALSGEPSNPHTPRTSYPSSLHLAEFLESSARHCSRSTAHVGWRWEKLLQYQACAFMPGEGEAGRSWLICSVCSRQSPPVQLLIQPSAWGGGTGMKG